MPSLLSEALQVHLVMVTVTGNISLCHYLCGLWLLASIQMSIEYKHVNI